MRIDRISSGLLLGLLGALVLTAPAARAQSSIVATRIVTSFRETPSSRNLSILPAKLSVSARPVSLSLRSLSLEKPSETPPPLLLSSTVSPGSSSSSLFSHMESSFQGFDTPFESQVRLPIASFWNGRLKLGGFESSLPMDYILWGLPGAGTMQDLRWAGGGHISALLPTDDNAFGLRLTLHLRGAAADHSDNSGLRGVHWILRAGRDFLHR